MEVYQRIAELILKHLKDELKPGEAAELKDFINESDANRELFLQCTNTDSLNNEVLSFYESRERILRKIKLAVNESDESYSSRSMVRKMWSRWAVAASIVGLLLVAGYFLVRSRESGVVSRESVVVRHDVKAPQTNRAMVTLSDGRKVFLDSAGSGQLAVQGGVQLMKLADGKIEYSSELKVQSSELAYNTLTNPRGSKVIDMTLADGSHVWLNAGSSITYPVAFIGDERKVTMTGEAYFEVKHDASKSFAVVANGVEVHDLGTSFNINAYNDEDAIRVTLLEGSVRVKSGVRSQESVVIKPGEQAYSVSNGQLAINKSVDVEQVMAWKNGLFYFSQADIATIMRQVARWYDVDVSYEGAMPSGHYNGKPSRDLTLSEMMKVVQYSGVKFRIEGKKIIITQ